MIKNSFFSLFVILIWSSIFLGNTHYTINLDKLTLSSKVIDGPFVTKSYYALSSQKEFRTITPRNVYYLVTSGDVKTITDKTDRSSKPP